MPKHTSRRSWPNLVKGMLVIGLALIVQALVGQALISQVARAQVSPPSAWLRLDALPGEMRLTSRESFDGVPSRFVLMTDGSVYVGGRREILRGSLDKAEMQEISTRLDLALKSFGKVGPPRTLTTGDGPAIFRFSVLRGSPLQIVVMGSLGSSTGSAPPAPLLDFIRDVAGFRHPSLRPFDPPQFAMIVRERTLAGGCRTANSLPPLAQLLSSEAVVPEALVRGFPTGSEMAQVCEGPKRYTVVFRPIVPGEH